MACKPDEAIAQVLAIKRYDVEPYLVLATRKGLVKKTPLAEYDSSRAGGLIAISLREGEEVVSDSLVNEKGEVLLVSRKGMAKQ